MSLIDRPTWLTLGTLTAADKPRLSELFSLIFPIEYPDTWYEKVTSGGNLITITALKEGEIIGVIIARVRTIAQLSYSESFLLDKAFPPYTPIAYILIIGIHPDHQKGGIGRLLLDLLLNFVSGRSVVYTEEESLLKTSRTIQEFHDSPREVKPYLVYPTLFLSDAYLVDFLRGLNYPQEFRFCQAVYLHTLHRNHEAIRFYLRNHFEFHCTIENLYKIDGNLEDAHIYVRYLNNGRAYKSLTARAYDYVMGASLVRSASGVLSYFSQPFMCSSTLSATQNQLHQNHNTANSEDDYEDLDSTDSTSSYDQEVSSAYNSDTSSSSSSNYTGAIPPFARQAIGSFHPIAQRTEEDPQALERLKKLGLDQSPSIDTFTILQQQEEAFGSDDDEQDSDPETNRQMIMRNEYIHTDDDSSEEESEDDQFNNSSEDDV